MVPETAVKISPGVDYAELPTDEAEVEFISLNGEMKEGVLWYGRFHSGVQRRATLLPDVATHSPQPICLQNQSIARYPQAYLVRTRWRSDPGTFGAGSGCARLSASQIDESIAYLTADTAVTTTICPLFCSSKPTFPFQLKKLRHYLRERNVGSVTIKKRGSPLRTRQITAAATPKRP